ncbi:MAG: hypothetical protein BGN84_00950 [Afipia sp. 62-7]|nr:hypothetical protein [Afipia sp.]OJU19083.1 MAG: hypothetical protein BGN84_00950 [Afipia sp. 62-7]
MPKQAEWVADVEFVISECVRIQKITATGKPADWSKELSKNDMLCHLPRADGQGIILCGAKAYFRLKELATTALRHSDALGTVQPDKVFEALRDLVSERFIFGEVLITSQTVEKAMATAVKEAKKGRSNVIHLIPCRLMYAKEPDSFAVGPVTFKTNAAFKAEMGPHYESYLAAEQVGVGVRDSYYLDEAQHYYDGFSWIARVEVLKCDHTISKERALLAVTAAVDILHIIFGAYYTERMVVAGPRMENDNRAHMTLSERSGLHVSLSSAATSAVGFGDGWGVFLKRPDIAFQLQAAARVIEPIVNPDISRPLGLKIADAAAWFGLAVREEIDASRIVKAITALERLILTDEKENLAELISQRAAAICCDAGHDIKGFDELAGRLKKAYDLRSRLVHGSLSPFDPEVRDSVDNCLILCEKVLGSALSFFLFHKLLDTPITNRQLSAGFSELVMQIKAKAESTTTRQA